MSDRNGLGAQIARLGASLFARRLTPGRTGNLSARLTEGFLVTPTNSSLAELDPDDLSTVTLSGEHVAGPQPSKEAFLHAAMYRARPDDRAIVHLHSPSATAVSCLADIDDEDVLPPLTAYYAMRIGRLPLLPYFAPGDPALGPSAERAAVSHHALLLANHGPIVSGRDLATAADAIEELEATAAIYLMTRTLPTRPLRADQRHELQARQRATAKPSRLSEEGP